MNLIAKIKKLEREVAELWSAIGRPEPKPAPAVLLEPESVAQSPTKRRGRPPKVKPDGH